MAPVELVDNAAAPPDDAERREDETFHRRRRKLFRTKRSTFCIVLPDDGVVHYQMRGTFYGGIQTIGVPCTSIALLLVAEDLPHGPDVLRSRNAAPDEISLTLVGASGIAVATMWRMKPPPDKTPTTKSASKPPKSTINIFLDSRPGLCAPTTTREDGFRRYPIGLIAKALPRNFVQKASWHSSGKPPGPLLIVMIPSDAVSTERQGRQYPQDINDAHIRVPVDI